MAKKPTTAVPKIVEGAFAALGSIMHNGELYEPGQIIEDLTEAEVASLLGSQAIEAVAVLAEPAAVTT